MKLYKGWPFHLIIRLVIFPLIALIIYYLIARNFSTDAVEGWRISFFGAASISCLTLMAESILLFQKRSVKKLYCNLSTIVSVVVFIIFFVPTL